VSSLLSAANRLIEAGGEAVVIGRPEVSYWGPGFAGHGEAWNSMPYWTGMRLEWDHHAGDRVELENAATEFLPYLRQIQRYSYSLTTAKGPEVYPPGSDPGPWAPLPQAIGHMKVETRGLIRTRHQGLVASEHTVSSPLSPPNHRPGRVVLLPPLSAEPTDSLEVLLREVYAVPVASPSPPWLDAIAAPGEATVNERLKQARAELAAVEARVRALQEERGRTRRCLALLTHGDEALEKEVRNVLRRLGAEVEDPVERNKEDGWITVRLTDATFEGVLEIKSTQGSSFGEQGLRQLLDWQSRGRSSRGKNYKGIFIGNSAYGRPPADRPDPFSASFRRNAADNDLAALTTTTLLHEFERIEAGALTHDAFWRAVFSAQGVFDGAPASPRNSTV
jgi:hypothetical protein